MNGTARWLQLLGLAALAAGLPGLDFGALLSWLSAGLLLLAALKLIEARTLRERRLVSLLTLIGGGVQGAQQPELLPSLLQLLATGLALAGLLALELGGGLSWRALLRRSLAVLLAALPVALLLFLLVPRIAPLWPAPSVRGGSAVTGLSATLDPGGIASLANNDAPAARVGFSGNGPPPPEQRYWRVLVHQRFDGQRWLRLEEPPSRRRSQPPTEPDPGQAPGPSQVWLVEPSPLNSLPWSGRGQGNRESLRLTPSGELQLRQPTPGRQAYLLRHTNRPSSWLQQPPTSADLALPLGRNPRLEALGTSWRSLPKPEQRLAAARAWFTSRGFRYSRSPGALPEQSGLDVFLFERQEGFCGHYASAFTALMRAAGVPARVVSGYLGGRWVQPLGGSPFLELRHSDAHAWSEVWLPERGWQRVDPSAWLGASASSPAGFVRAAAGLSSPPGWRRAGEWLQWQWWGLDLAWNRWWLGFDRASQEALLHRLFGNRRQTLGLVLLVGTGGLLALGLAALHWGQRRQPGRSDPLARELRRLLRLLARLGIDAQPGDTVDSLCQRAGRRHPNARATLEVLAEHHNQLRYAPLSAQQRSRHWAGWRTALQRLGQHPRETL